MKLASEIDMFGMERSLLSQNIGLGCNLSIAFVSSLEFTSMYCIYHYRQCGMRSEVQVLVFI